MKRGEKGAYRHVLSVLDFEITNRALRSPFDFTLLSLLFKRPIFPPFSQKGLVLFPPDTASQIFQPLSLFPCELVIIEHIIKLWFLGLLLLRKPNHLSHLSVNIPVKEVWLDSVHGQRKEGIEKWVRIGLKIQR